MKKNYVIIGNSAAGVSAAEEIRKHDKTSEIVIVSDEKGPAYSRCLLSYYISGQISKEILTFRDTKFYSKNNIKLLDGKNVTGINRKERKITLDDGKSLSYHKLLISTGASARDLPIRREDKTGLFVVRTIDDAEKILKKLDIVKSAVVLGAGLIGVKIAHALYKRDKKVFIVAKSSRVLSQILDSGSSEFLGKTIEEKVSFLKGLDAKEIIYDGDKISGITLTDNKKIDCQMVIVAKGVLPNIRILKDTGLNITNGIIVDETMKTNDENIYAAGDVAETLDLLTGQRDIKALWTSAVEQGKIAGKNMTGDKAVYDGALLMNSVECFGIPCISAGNLKGELPEVFDFRLTDPVTMRRIFIKDNKICGFVTIGDIRFAGILNKLLKEKKDISGIKEKLNSMNLTRSDLLECMGKEEVVSLMEKK